MQLSGTKKKVRIDAWLAKRGKKEGLRRGKGHWSRFKQQHLQYIIKAITLRGHVLSLCRFPVVFSILSIVLVFILLFCFVWYGYCIPTMCSFPQASLMTSFRTELFML